MSLLISCLDAARSFLISCTILLIILAFFDIDIFVEVSSFSNSKDETNSETKHRSKDKSKNIKQAQGSDQVGSSTTEKAGEGIIGGNRSAKGRGRRKGKRKPISSSSSCHDNPNSMNTRMNYLHPHPHMQEIPCPDMLHSPPYIHPRNLPTYPTPPIAHSELPSMVPPARKPNGSMEEDAFSWPDSTGNTVPTPPASVAEILNLDVLLANVAFSVPRPGETYIIGSSVRGLVLTLLDGRPILDHIGGHGSILWTCFENKGWIGFRNPASGRVLGHKADEKRCTLECRVPHHRGHEYVVLQQAEGGYIIRLVIWGSKNELRALGHCTEDGVERIVLLDINATEDPIIWNFIKYDA